MAQGALALTVIIMAMCGVTGMASVNFRVQRPIAKAASIRSISKRAAAVALANTQEAEGRSLLTRLKHEGSWMRRAEGSPSTVSDGDDSNILTTLSAETSTNDAGGVARMSLRARAKEESRWRNGFNPDSGHPFQTPEKIQSAAELLARQTPQQTQEEVQAEMTQLRRENRMLRQRLADAGLLKERESVRRDALDVDESTLTSESSGQEPDLMPSEHAMAVLRMAELACRKEGMRVEPIKQEDARLSELTKTASPQDMPHAFGERDGPFAREVEDLAGLDWSHSSRDDL